MKVLAVDTSSRVASCAIMEDDRLLGEYTVNNKLTHSVSLMPMIDALLTSCECSVSDIDIFAASDGPGSYTGLRIGVATVKGLAAAADKKVVGVNSLEALAMRLPHAEHLITPIMDARKGRVFTATYLWEDGEMRQVSEPCVTTIEECVEECGNFLDTIFTGDGISIHKDYIKEKLGEHAFFASPDSAFASASAVAALAIANSGSATEPDALAPKYIGKSQLDNK